MKLKRLWQPANKLFWMMLFFNIMSSVCTYVMRAYPWNMAGQLLLAAIALVNVFFGLAAAWMLMRDEPTSTGP